MPRGQDPNGWSEYEKLVLATLDRLGNEAKATRDELRAEIQTIRREVLEKVAQVCDHTNENSRLIAVLKAKSTILGLVAGAIAGGLPAVTALVIWLISR